MKEPQWHSSCGCDELSMCMYHANIKAMEQLEASGREFNEFITKDSGKRQEYASGMHRDTQENKARFDLMYLEGVPYEEQPLTRLADLLARGAQKYTARNWELAQGEEELERFKASALRHLTQYLCGDRVEDHQAAVIFNLFGTILVEYKMRSNGENV